jgi:hypothetical protein
MLLPYCKNCGAKLEETAKFCPSCGTSVAGRLAEERVIERGRPVNFFGFFLIAVILAAVLYGFVSFLPIRPVDVHENRNVPFQIGVQAVVVDLTVDVGNVNVTFSDLADDAVSFSLSVSGYGSLLSNQPYTLTFEQATNGNVLTVTSEVETSVLHGWLNLNFLETECDLVIDPSLNASITVRTGTGGISFETRSGVVLNSVRLETATGAIGAIFAENTIVTRDITIKTVTGAQSLSWRNVIAERDVAVDIGSVTGAISVDIEQDERLRNSIELDVEVTTGAISLALDISGDAAAKIASSTTTGSVDVQRSNGFTGSSTQLQSNNYPSDSQFDITLQTTTGGINIDARFSP